MKYKILKGTDTFKHLENLMDRRKDCNEAATALLIELGGSGDHKRLTNLNTIGGGIAGIELGEKPEGWKKINGYHGFYFPLSNKKNQALLQRIADLPVVTQDELNEVLGFKEQWQGLTMYRQPGLFERNEFFLMEISDKCDFTPNSDMIEILSSEFKTLKEEE